MGKRNVKRWVEVKFSKAFRRKAHPRVGTTVSRTTGALRIKGYLRRPRDWWKTHAHPKGWRSHKKLQS